MRPESGIVPPARGLRRPLCRRAVNPAGGRYKSKKRWSFRDRGQKPGHIRNTPNREWCGRARPSMGLIAKVKLTNKGRV